PRRAVVAPSLLSMVYYDYRFFGAPNYTYVFEDNKVLYNRLPMQPQDDKLNIKPFRREYFMGGEDSHWYTEVLCLVMPIIAYVSYNILIHIASTFHLKKFARNYQSADASKQEASRGDNSSRQKEDHDVVPQ
ncbi:hypothetical protein PFISCL1PPCAC_4992, partial [Pristionchus fissidentatus]